MVEQMEWGLEVEKRSGVWSGVWNGVFSLDLEPVTMGVG